MRGDILHPGREQFAQVAEGLLIEKIEKRNFPRTAKVLGRWFTSLRENKIDPAKTPAFADILRSVDPTRVYKSRRYALQQAHAKQKAIAEQLAAAFVLDDSESEEFTALARSFLSERVKGDAKERSFDALFLANPLLADIFSGDVEARMKGLSNGELSWVLGQMENSSKAMLSTLVQEIIARDIVPPYQAIFLHILGDTGKANFPAEVRGAFIRATLGTVTEAEVQAFKSWGGIATERALLAVCAIAPASRIAGAALDVLATRLLHTEPARQLVKWSKDRAWDARQKLAKPIGILGLVDIASDTDITFAFDELMGVASGSKLFEAALNSNNRRLILEVVERIGPIMGDKEMLKLLGHEFKEVRMAAVRGLKGRNNVMVLHEISLAYEKEEDKDVRQVYKDEHWVARVRD